MHLKVRRSSYLLLGHLDLKIIWAELNAAHRQEGQVTAANSLFDRDELRLVRFDADVHLLQFADFFAVKVDDLPARWTSGGIAYNQFAVW